MNPLQARAYPEALAAPYFKVLSQVARTCQQPSYVIGGYVRDFLLGHTPVEADVVTLGSGIALAKAFAEAMDAPEVVVYENFGTAMVRLPQGATVEFVGARKESYRADSRKPLVEDGTLLDDQLRRDFTVNALSLSLQEEDFGALQDPFEGLQDLAQRILRTPRDPDITFSDDPLRMLRAIRFATRLGFRIAENALEAIPPNLHRLEIVSQERITEELNKIILADFPSLGFKLLFRTGILQRIFPEFVLLHGVERVNGRAHKDNFYHTLQVLDNLATTTNYLWLRWAALLHDIAKPQTKRYDPTVGWTFHGHEERGARMVPGIFQRLRLPQHDAMRYVQKLVRLHLRPIALVDEGVSDSAIRRLIVEAGEDLPDLMKLCRADITTRDADKVERYLANFDRVEDRILEVEERDHLRNWQPPVTGQLIMQTFGLQPGPAVGQIKEAVRNAILDGIIPNEPEPALSYMHQVAAQLLAGKEPHEQFNTDAHHKNKDGQ